MKTTHGVLGWHWGEISLFIHGRHLELLSYGLCHTALTHHFFVTVSCVIACSLELRRACLHNPDDSPIPS